jgi:hypothetical protein
VVPFTLTLVAEESPDPPLSVTFPDTRKLSPASLTGVVSFAAPGRKVSRAGKPFKGGLSAAEEGGFMDGGEAFATVSLTGFFEVVSWQKAEKENRVIVQNSSKVLAIVIIV